MFSKLQQKGNIGSSGVLLSANLGKKTVSKDQYVSANYSRLNPADPTIQGFVKDSNGAVVSNLTVQLLDRNGNIIKSYSGYIPGDQSRLESDIKDALKTGNK